MGHIRYSIGFQIFDRGEEIKDLMDFESLNDL